MLVEAIGSFNTTDVKKKKGEEKRGALHLPLQRMQSFIRAHDLALADDENLNIRKSENALVSVDSNGSGAAIINALVTIGLQEATDESSRWTATSSTIK